MFGLDDHRFQFGSEQPWFIFTDPFSSTSQLADSDAATELSARSESESLETESENAGFLIAQGSSSTIIIFF